MNGVTESNDLAFRAAMTRRTFLSSLGAATLAAGCSHNASQTDRAPATERMIVLGVDGFDPELLERFVAQGLMPNCKRLMETGSFRRLRTSDPPQSPVAWSNFISGTNPGGHGIFDFFARDPQSEKFTPFLSMARAEQAGAPLRFGKWKIPLSSGRIRNLRKGPTFWTQLEDRGIPCTVLRVPANFPPTEGEVVSLSGMGTPDVLGGYGTFAFYTDDPSAATREVQGGRIDRVEVHDHVARCVLPGPENSFVADEDDPAKARAQEIEREEKRRRGEVMDGFPDIPFQVYLDPSRPLAKIVIQDQAFVLAEGEWSEWIPVRFQFLPHLVDVAGICRFFLKQAQGRFALYVSPVNIDPAHPALPISTPPDYSRRLVRELGYFYTQGMAEDTKALSAGVLSSSEYRQQATFVLDERMRFFKHELARFQRGFFFHYFSNLDLSSHVFWRTIDPQHPLYSAALAGEQGDFIPSLYKSVDEAIGLALASVDDRTVLCVMSDHGFTSFRRQFNLNSWLMDNLYIRPLVSRIQSVNSYLADVDWRKTKAYGLGFNGLYLNLKGREVHGIVNPGKDADELCRRLIAQLTAYVDPDTGERVISNVFRANEIYSGPYAADGPDLIVAYNNFYRASNETVRGEFPRAVVLDNTDAWSGDHCVDSKFVPGVLLCNRKVLSDKPALEDLAPTILAQFGIPAPAEMTGKNLL
jgi:predicted AlkP superfamily phosphohydrolase/phosphomutase